MDLGFPRFDKESGVAPLPSDLAVLLVGVAARQAASPTARIEQRQTGTPRRNGLLAPASGAFNPGTAAAIADWKRE